MKLSAGRKRLFVLTALLFSVTFACGVAEVGLRLGGYDRTYVNPLHSFHQRDSRVGHRGKSNFTGRFHSYEFDVVVSHNEHGFRKNETRGSAHPCQRAFVLGYSFTWGGGVGQGKVFTEAMRRLLPEFDVQNFGLNGSGTVQQYRIFEDRIRDSLRTGDVVIVNFCFNDFSDNVSSSLSACVVDGKVETRGPRELDNSLKDELKDASCLFNLIAYRLDHWKLQGKIEERRRRGINPSAASAPPADDEEDAVMRHFLGRFQADCEAAGSRFLVVHTGNERLETCARGAGAETFDLSPSLRAAVESERFERIDFPTDAHWNESGHIVVGEEISEYLKSTSQIAAVDSSPIR